MQDQKEIQDLLLFQTFYKSRKSKSTLVLSVIIIAIFLLEEFFGGSKNTFNLVRMGANVDQFVREGQYYRIFSSVFLHAGLMHVFFNTYVLYALGGFFNKILGETKFLCIFFVSGLGGSLASIFFGKSAVSVGASGAIWGFFGASISLAFFKTRFIPEIVRERLKRVTLINLIINIGVSFLPMVDFWAHFGGGLCGFLLSIPMITGSHQGFAAKTKKIIFKFLAIFLAAIYLGAFSYGLVLQTPWKKTDYAQMDEVNEASWPIGFKIPKTHIKSLQKGMALNEKSLVFGRLGLDEFVLEFQYRQDPSIKLLGESWLEKQRKLILSDGSVDTAIKKSVDLISIDFGRALTFDFPIGQNAKVNSFFVVINDYSLRLNIVAQKDFSIEKISQISNAILKSVFLR